VKSPRLPAKKIPRKIQTETLPSNGKRYSVGELGVSLNCNTSVRLRNLSCSRFVEGVRRWTNRLSVARNA
jgi:hypothetical protein